MHSSEVNIAKQTDEFEHLKTQYVANAEKHLQFLKTLSSTDITDFNKRSQLNQLRCRLLQSSARLSAFIKGNN